MNARLISVTSIILDIHRGLTTAAISLKLSDLLLEASARCAGALQLSRAEYICRAIERLNRETRAGLRADRLARASRKVRGESSRVNAEFDAIERDVDT